MTAFIIWLIVGGLLGWLASIALRAGAQQDVLLNSIVGIVGAFLGSLAIGNGRVMAPDYSWQALAATVLGSIILLAAVNLLRRDRVR